MDTKKRKQPVVDDGKQVQISGFEIRERLGAGGMAVVWKAYQASLDRVVAIKVLRSEYAADPEEVRLFMDEARSAAKLSHPNIVQVHDTGSENGIHYFVMEYIAGRTVGQQVRRHGALPLKQVFRVATCVAEALDYAWRKSGIVHCDIKPDNIMLDEDGMVKVADLGLASAAHIQASRVSDKEAVIEGTPNFMAPEQIDGSPADCRTDMYALGGTMYHMATGCLPFEGLSDEDVVCAQLEGQLRNPRDINHRLPLGLVQLLSRLMMKAPQDRPADWSEALREIKQVASGRVLWVKGTKGESTIARPVESHPLRAASSTPAGDGRKIPSCWRTVRVVLLLLIWLGFAFWMLIPFMRRLQGVPHL